MSARQSILPTDRGRVESVLALCVFVLVAIWFSGAQIPLQWVPFFEYLLLPVTLLVPGVLALLILAGVLACGVRLGVTLIETGSLPQSPYAALIRIVGSVVYGVVAANTLWYAAASFYVIYFGDPGGVLLHPFVVLALGSVLSVLVLLRESWGRLRSGRTLPRRVRKFAASTDNSQ